MALQTSNSYTQQDAAQHMYDSRAPNYDDSFHPIFAAQVAESLNLQPGERLLDLACGTGLVTLPASQHVGPTGSVVGVDITRGMLAELQRKLDKEPDIYKNVTVHRHDITALHELQELEEGSFDAISCASALVLLKAPDLALKSWAQYLKPGGRLVTDSTDSDNLPEGISLEHVHRRLGIEPPSYRLWAHDGSSLAKIMQQAGLDVEKTWFQVTTGKGTEYHEVSEWESRFEEAIKKPFCRALVEKGQVNKAKELFKEEWERLGTHNGKIRETDGVWVAIGRKPVEKQEQE